VIKNLLLPIVIALLSTGFACAQDFHYQSGYVKKDGTVVPGHYQTNPNESKADNWSTIGNTNPITGQPGHKNPYDGTSGGGSSGGYTPRK
jgi:hypothetical protein